MSGRPAAARVSGLSHPLAPWPYELLDVAAMRDSGRPATPFRDFVLKVHQRCNLACDYCYVYTMADQTWRDRPAMMAPEVWRAAARRIAEHARTHDLPVVRVILHGGEPLLAGRDRLLSLVTDLRATLPSGCRAEIGLQTNGVLLDQAMLSALRRHSIVVGISLDGPPEDNDRHRRHADGRGSFAAVDRALALLGEERHRSSFAGLLCTVDPSTDPGACYEQLIRHRPPAIDFLLPHGNWSSPPPAAAAGGTPYADWLIAVFDRWYDAPRKETAIRLFEEIINLVLGGASRSEQVGLSPVGVVVIETDGAIEQVDSLKSTYEGACSTGLNVSTDPLDDALDHPGIVARQIGAAALCDGCLQCSVHQVCGAGHYAHRFRAGAGFRNPSVYCGDLRLLIRHIQHRVTADVARKLGSAIDGPAASHLR
jgi:uncharacterized protein